MTSRYVEMYVDTLAVANSSGVIGRTTCKYTTHQGEQVVQKSRSHPKIPKHRKDDMKQVPY